jgi:hypothetical protein
MFVPPPNGTRTTFADKAALIDIYRGLNEGSEGWLVFMLEGDTLFAPPPPFHMPDDIQDQPVIISP